MNRWIIAGLVVLNVMLGVTLWLKWPENTAKAQIGSGRGDFAVVAGSWNNQSVIYVMEVSTGRLVAFKTDVLNKQIKVADAKRVGEDIQRVH